MIILQKGVQVYYSLWGSCLQKAFGRTWNKHCRSLQLLRSVVTCVLCKDLFPSQCRSLIQLTVQLRSSSQLFRIITSLTHLMKNRRAYLASSKHCLKGCTHSMDPFLMGNKPCLWLMNIISSCWQRPAVTTLRCMSSTCTMRIELIEWPAKLRWHSPGYSGKAS